MIVEGGSWETYALCCLVIVQQPLELQWNTGLFFVFPPQSRDSQTDPRKLSGNTCSVKPLQMHFLKQPLRAIVTIKLATKTASTNTNSNISGVERQKSKSKSSRSRGKARASIRKSNLHGCWAASFSDWINPQIFGASQSPFQSDKPWSTGQQNVRERGGNAKTKAKWRDGVNTLVNKNREHQRRSQSKHH